LIRIQTHVCLFLSKIESNLWIYTNPMNTRIAKQQPSNRKMDSLPTYEIIMSDQLALVMIEKQSSTELAIHIGTKYLEFNTDDVDLLRVFWGPLSDEPWFYCPKEYVVKYFGYKDTRDTMADFAKHQLSNYKKDVNYQIVTNEHHLVKKYEDQSCSASEPSSSHNINLGGAGKNKKHYLLSNDTVEDILQEVKTEIGKKTRRFFRRVNKLAKFVLEIINKPQLLANVETEQLRKELEQAKQLIVKATTETGHFKKHIKTITLVEPIQWIYIAGTYDDACQNVFKYGGADSFKLLKKRQDSYNTGRSIDKPMKIMYAIQCHNYHFVETCIKQFLKGFHENLNTRKETLNIDFNDLCEAVFDIVYLCQYATSNLIESKINSYIDRMYGSSAYSFDKNFFKQVDKNIEYKIVNKDEIKVVNMHEDMFASLKTKRIKNAKNNSKEFSKNISALTENEFANLSINYDESINSIDESINSIDDEYDETIIDDSVIDDSVIDEYDDDKPSSSYVAIKQPALPEVSQSIATPSNLCPSNDKLDELINILNSLKIPEDKCKDVVIQKTMKHFKEILIQAVRDSKSEVNFSDVTKKLNTRERAAANGVPEIKKLINNAVKDTSIRKIIKIKCLGK